MRTIYPKHKKDFKLDIRFSIKESIRQILSLLFFKKIQLYLGKNDIKKFYLQSQEVKDEKSI